MIAAGSIKQILSGIAPGTMMTVKEIQDYVGKRSVFTPDDLAPHTKTRPTKYPRWKHRLQAELAEMKKVGKVQHIPEQEAYIF